MKTHSFHSFGLVVLAGIALVAPAFGVLSMDFVTVGNAGNAPDTRPGTGFGAVTYDYQIGKTEVTNAQYVTFLNAVADADPNGLYAATMNGNARGGITRTGAAGSFNYVTKANMGDKPVNYVSWYDAARFSNWLHNGQPTGAQGPTTTEGGAYTLTGNTGIILANPGAKFRLPTEDEWYKAAYYNPATSSYSLYPTRSNTAPTLATADASGNIANPGANVANSNNGADWNALDGNLTTVGSAGALSASYYGTYDQGGNVSEWNDAVIAVTDRGHRGGSWLAGVGVMRSTNISNSLVPTSQAANWGFRIVAIPEPGSWVSLACLVGSGAFLRSRRRGAFNP